MKTPCSLAAVLLVVTVTTAVAATPAQTCRAGKNLVAGKYAACRHAAEAKLATSENAAAYATALAKCSAKYAAAWQKLETKAAGACPSNGDTAVIENVVDDATTTIATALGGGGLAECRIDLAQCTSDLGACAAEPHGQPLETGQTGCYDATGADIACAGTGQDGELQHGLARSYTDNGDGTITDDRTGLVWEKLSDDGSIHDKDDVYSWADAFAVKVAALNGGSGFAGHTDWRVPNRFELESLIDLGSFAPAIPPAFRTACDPGCTILTCSCTATTTDRIYWSSTASTGYPPWAWRVDYNSGDIVSSGKETSFYVRAVRGGD